MSIDFVAYEDAVPTGTLARIASEARERRLKFYGRMRRNWYVPPPAPEPEVVAEPSPPPQAAIARKPPGFDQTVVIQRIVAARYGMTKNTLLARDNRPSVVVPRQIAMMFTKEFTPHSVHNIGNLFAYRDHSSVLAAVKRCTARADRDPEFAAELEQIRAELTEVLL